MRCCALFYYNFLCRRFFLRVVNIRCACAMIVFSVWFDHCVSGCQMVFSVIGCTLGCTLHIVSGCVIWASSNAMNFRNLFMLAQIFYVAFTHTHTCAHRVTYLHTLIRTCAHCTYLTHRRMSWKRWWREEGEEKTICISYFFFFFFFSVLIIFLVWTHCMRRKERAFGALSTCEQCIWMKRRH